MSHLLNITHWVSTLGYVGIFIIVLVETGAFFGFFLPRDSLVFTAGMLAAKSVFNIWILVPLLIGTAILGYTIGYWFGDKLGHWLLKRKESIWFKRRYIDQAHQFYNKHGGKALVLGRLVPVVRTFVPIVAGMVEVPYLNYIFYNVVGAIVWGGIITLAGYYLGTVVPDAVNYILPTVMLIVVLSVIPGVIHFLKKR